MSSYGFCCESGSEIKNEKDRKIPRSCCNSGPRNKNEREKYPDLARGETAGNIKVTVIPTAVGAHGTVPECLERRLEILEVRGRIESILKTALLR